MPFIFWVLSWIRTCFAVNANAYCCMNLTSIIIISQYTFPEFICCHDMSHENEAILSKLSANRYSHVIFGMLKSTVLRYSITFIGLMYLSLGSIPVWQI